MEKKNMDIMMERMERAGFENIKDRIMFGVMNHERNQDIAEQAFHIKWNDLLIFFYIEGTFLNGTAYHCPVSIDMAERQGNSGIHNSVRFSEAVTKDYRDS